MIRGTYVTKPDPWDFWQLMWQLIQKAWALRGARSERTADSANGADFPGAETDMDGDPEARKSHAVALRSRDIEYAKPRGMTGRRRQPNCERAIWSLHTRASAPARSGLRIIYEGFLKSGLRGAFLCNFVHYNCLSRFDLEKCSKKIWLPRALCSPPLEYRLGRTGMHNRCSDVAGGI
jgi:hypothetical protein